MGATRWALVVALLAVLSGTPASAQVVTGVVTGRFDDDVQALPFAMVEGVNGDLRVRALTDGEGRYVLPGFGPGEVILSVTHAGYQAVSLAIVVPREDSVEVDVQLTAVPVPLTPLDVRATRGAVARTPEGDAEPGGLPALDMHVLEVGPGTGQAGIADVVAALPGNDPGDATDVLFMRGSTTDLKLVLLDGVPVFTPFHVAGLIRSFEPSVLGSAELHVGGAPARFDGGLTHILELSTRSPAGDDVHFSGSMDLLSASAAVEVPLGGRAGVVASGRSLHDLASAPLDRVTPYGYRDALVAFRAQPAAGHELRATGFWNAESVALDLQPARDDARWSNRAGSVGYRADLTGARVELTAGLSEYQADLPLQPSLQPGGPPAPALLATAETQRARVVGEVVWGAPSAELRTGLSFDRIDARFGAAVLGGGASAVGRGVTSTVGAFIDITRPLAPGLSLRGGLRVDHFAARATRLAPRASISWAVGPEALLTVTAGRYHQPTRTPEVEVEQTLIEVTQAGVPSSELLPLATADHVVLSLDQRLTESVRLGLEGFWKAYQGLPGAAGQSVRSSGLDLRVLSGSDRAAAWLGYGLSWFWSTTDLSGRASDFSGRHLLTAGVSGGLGGPLRGEARVAYGAGLPYTSIPVGFGAAEAATSDQSAAPVASNVGPLAPGLDESFLRLDLEIFAVFEPTWGSRGWRVRPYLRLLNALDRRDALFYTYEPWLSDAARPLAELPVLPLVGVAVAF